MAGIEVRVQVWGPMEASGAGYSWITIGVIKEPGDFDLNVLKGRVVEFVKRSEYKPTTNMARLEFRRGGKAYMKAVFLDVWEE